MVVTIFTVHLVLTLTETKNIWNVYLKNDIMRVVVILEMQILYFAQGNVNQ